MKPVTFAHAMPGRSPIALDPLRLTETRLLAQASSGGGKSYALRRLLEVTHGRVQQLVIDPEGEFNSLRDRFEYVYVGKGGDIEPDPKTAGMLATQLLELGVSAILDIYELHPRDRRAFVRAFLDALNTAPKRLWHPVLVVLDEAHVFAPEQGESEAMDAVVTLASQGRKKSFGLLIATQRLPKLHKDVAAECQNKIIGLANMDIDRKRAAAELGFTSKEDILSLRNLEPGEMYVLGPAVKTSNGKPVKDATIVKIDEVVTPHGRKAKTWSPGKVAPTGVIKKALAELAALPKRVEEEAKTSEGLRAQVRELKRELAAARRGIPKVDPKMAEEHERLRHRNSILEKTMKSVSQFKNRIVAKAEELVALAKQLPTDLELGSPIVIPGGTPIMTRSPAPGRLELVRPKAPPVTVGDLRVGNTERAVLRFLSGWEGKWFTRAQIGVQTGYSRRSSSFNAAVGALAKHGLVSLSGDRYAITEHEAPRVREILGEEYGEGATTDPRDWIRKLDPTPAKIFEVLLESRGEAFDRDTLAEVTGYSATSSSFNAAFGLLRQLELIEQAPDHKYRVSQAVAS
jgi:hypothetical protein